MDKDWLTAMREHSVFESFHVISVRKEPSQSGHVVTLSHGGVLFEAWDASPATAFEPGQRCYAWLDIIADEAEIIDAGPAAVVFGLESWSDSKRSPRLRARFTGRVLEIIEPPERGRLLLILDCGVKATLSIDLMILPDAPRGSILKGAGILEANRADDLAEE